jgi:hypothetical protein
MHNHKFMKIKRNKNMPMNQKQVKDLNQLKLKKQKILALKVTIKHLIIKTNCNICKI